MRFLKEPFGQAVAILAVAWALVEFGIPYIPPLLGVASAPVPASVTLQYMLTVLVGVLLWVSDNEERWRAFKRPIHRTVVDPDRKWPRIAALILAPLLVAFLTYGTVRPTLAAPPSFRSVHPAPPSTITFRGETLRLAGLENPLRHEGDPEAHFEEGKRIYYQNCMACHGDALRGDGHYAHGFNPAPLSFQDVGTIAMLTESFVFWRIAKGGPGLPNEGTPWNSAMPAWEDYLTAEDIWAVIYFMYEQTGHSPRTWEEAEIEGEVE
ncbi:MAG: cytochrome c [Gemmatimonadetes bacterium]|nr:cytochrome c [Gemmatimonadota bacterium]